MIRQFQRLVILKGNLNHQTIHKYDNKGVNFQTIEKNGNLRYHYILDTKNIPSYQEKYEKTRNLILEKIYDYHQKGYLEKVVILKDKMEKLRSAR